jgi:hypothetical protein
VFFETAGDFNLTTYGDFVLTSFTPEPPSLVLMSLGLAAVGVAAWIRRIA